MPQDGLAVFLVFRSPETMEKVRRAVCARGYAVEGAFASGGAALRFAGGRDVDIAVVGSDVADMGVQPLCQELTERCGCEVILLLQGGGSEATLSEKLGERVTCLPRPVTVELLLSALDAAARYRRKLKEMDREVRRYRETLERRAVSEKAKAVLMETRGMTEDAAWRHLQRTSMDTGRPMVEIAKEILALREEGMGER